MKKIYIYKGKNKIELIGFGIVAPGDEVEVDFEINNLLFEEKKDKKLKKIKS